MRRTWYTLLILLIPAATLQAQYFQYSMYQFTGQRVNPAMTGLTRYASAGINYRNQQTGGDFGINSNFFSATYPLLNSSTGHPWSGIGLSLHNDQAGGFFKTQEIGLSYALHVRLSKFQSLSFGAKGLYQARRIGLDNYYTGSQYIPDRGFDRSISSGESFPELRNSFKTFSAGLYWQEVDRKGRVKNYFGISLFDVNRPKDSFLGTTSQLASTFIFNAAIETYSTKDFHIIPEALLSISGGVPTINGGFRFQKELNVSAKKQSDLVDVILKYAVRRSAIAGIMFHRENISVGLSYDFPLITKQPSNIGALEFAVELRKLMPTRAQKITAKRKKQQEEARAKRNAQQQKQIPATPPAEVAKNETKPVVPTEIVSDSTEVQPVTVTVTPDSLTTKGAAKAGRLKQDPLIIEKVTLHFAFEFNSADLDDPTENFLTEMATTMKEDERLQLIIVGHTDNIGSDKFNLRLSQKRAEVVRHHLIRLGIDPSRLVSEGKGMHEPLNNNETDADRAKNRRVEITLLRR